ncbi:MAG: YdeI/OmpD-associated family protein [Planctomycetota bacterium]
MEVDLDRVRSFKTPAAWSRWLSKNHDCETVVWLKIYKKASGVASVDWEQAVIEALAWGWIDGLKKSCDDEAYYQRFTPRGPRSKWSQKNVGHVERLIAEKRMQPPGLLHVKAAKKDGRWAEAYGSSRNFEMPADFVAAVKKSRAASKTFESLTRRSLYLIYYRLQDAKRPETRKKRFNEFLDLLKRGDKPG